MDISNQSKKPITKTHKDTLGMGIPQDFFATSKEDILNRVMVPTGPKPPVFWLKPIVAYPIAASIVIAVALTFWTQNNTTKTNNQITDSKEIRSMDPQLFEDDFLVPSLLVSDSEVNQYVDNYITSNIVVQAELSEEQLDDILINSLFIEDSLTKDYLNESLIEHIVI